MPKAAAEEPAGRSIELKLAHQLLSQESGIGRDVLYELLARPKRYSELKPVLEEGKSENSLTVALKTLRRNGLVDQRTDARSSPAVHRYELTPLGINVVLAMESLRPLEAQLTLLREAFMLSEKVSGEEILPPASADLVASRAEAPQVVQANTGTTGTTGARETWHVTPDPDGGWRVQRPDATRATRVLDTKKEAVEFARKLAKRETGRQVVVHKADGTIQKHFAPA